MFHFGRNAITFYILTLFLHFSSPYFLLIKIVSSLCTFRLFFIITSRITFLILELWSCYSFFQNGLDSRMVPGSYHLSLFSHCQLHPAKLYYSLSQIEPLFSDFFFFCFFFSYAFFCLKSEPDPQQVVLWIVPILQFHFFLKDALFSTPLVISKNKPSGCDVFPLNLHNT